MKTYELILERRQPTCGGKDPKLVTVSTVHTDDPEAYVREQEKNGEITKEVLSNGDIVFTLDAGLKAVKYTFSEI